METVRLKRVVSKTNLLSKNYVESDFMKRKWMKIVIDSWRDVDGWDKVQKGLDLMTDDDWAIAIFSPGQNEMFFNAPLKKQKKYMLDKKIKGCYFTVINGAVPIENIGCMLVLGLFEEVEPGMIVSFRGVEKVSLFKKIKYRFFIIKNYFIGRMKKYVH